jgi:hypothetical protein
VKRRSLIVVGMVWSNHCDQGKAMPHDRRRWRNLGATGCHEKLWVECRSVTGGINAYFGEDGCCTLVAMIKDFTWDGSCALHHIHLYAKHHRHPHVSFSSLLGELEIEMHMSYRLCILTTNWIDAWTGCTSMVMN